MSGSFYYLAGYPLDGFRIARFVGIMVVLSVFSQDFGILLGTLWSMKVKIDFYLDRYKKNGVSVSLHKSRYIIKVYISRTVLYSE